MPTHMRSHRRTARTAGNEPNFRQEFLVNYLLKPAVQRKKLVVFKWLVYLKDRSVFFWFFLDFSRPINPTWAYIYSGYKVYTPLLK